MNKDKDIVIKVEGISKKYSVGKRQPYLTLRDQIVNKINKPFARKEKNRSFWALKNIDFEVNQGEVLGVVGQNGAGKSTLLKIISRITEPTSGKIQLKGRVSSLLEVGSGFSPELTGRENIYLNGSILGMTKKEINEQLESIIDFAGVREFIDTPIKHYSSGMYMRLAFSVAAHLQSDIVIIDEVLAVGDVEFRKKCLGKMHGLAKSGRTILFVSHDMSAIQTLCTRAIRLQNGKIVDSGLPSKVIKSYLTTLEGSDNAEVKFKRDVNKRIQFTKIGMTQKGKNTTKVRLDSDFEIHSRFEVRKDFGQVEISVLLKNSNGVNVVFMSLSDDKNSTPANLRKGKYKTITHIPKNWLTPDNYSVRLSAHHRGVEDFDLQDEVLPFTIIDTGNPLSSFGTSASYWSGVLPKSKWEISKDDK